ncbi:MAG: hypothetical protein M3O31_11335 [Acidobacteriota bacterium]|nr:hypothetical protein [Acidobacteriota bacterium]
MLCRALLAQDDGILIVGAYVRIGNIYGQAFGGDVEVLFGEQAPAFLFDLGDHVGGVVADAKAATVVGGEAESFEEGVGLTVGEASGSEGVDDGGDCDLDGGAVLECRQLKRDAGDEAEGGFVAVNVVGAGEAVVEVTESRTGESYTVALEAVGFDVATDGDLHFGAPWLPPLVDGGLVKR